ncbi:hypothetical protein [Streptosporangium sp. NPDC051022]|uniref:hypothetical protein n=1 Tax=Streptosporangium sp. NPDC051022 TaxID=3155752 RepID=UPI0034230F36
MNKELLKEPLAREICLAGEGLLADCRWVDEPVDQPRFDLRIHRDRGLGGAVLRVEVEGRIVSMAVDPSLMRPSLPSLLTQAAREIGCHFI